MKKIHERACEMDKYNDFREKANTRIKDLSESVEKCWEKKDLNEV